MTKNLVSQGPPEHFDRWAETGICNLDGAIHAGFESALRSGPIWGEHTAWEFYGKVWFDGTLFHEQVWRHKAPVAHVAAPSLDALLHAVNDEWGWR
jgi:hypothetical protein